MTKKIHEIRDPIHIFIQLNSHERQVVDSPFFQRLRQIHQLALTYLLYPGASHKRFEHSLGVMALAERVFNIITAQANISEAVKERLKELTDSDALAYWRRVLKMAALCHDLGHIPFSHAAEKELLPDGWDHEKITWNIINSDELKSIWNQGKPDLCPIDIAKLAIGPKKARNVEFTEWERILSEIIVGDAFGVDRMDYLLRDSHHIGVAYGKFDHYRLIDTLRILPSPLPDKKDDQTGEPALGLEEGGLQSAESLMLARYLMFSQVYYHPVRLIYDIHLKDFMNAWLNGKMLGCSSQEHLKLTDNEINVALSEYSSKGAPLALRITQHEHYKVIYERNPEDLGKNKEAGAAVFKALGAEFGEELFRHSRQRPKGGVPDFPVQLRDEQIVSSLDHSEVLQKLPEASYDYVFADRSILEKAGSWLKKNKEQFIIPKGENEHDG